MDYTVDRFTVTNDASSWEYDDGTGEHTREYSNVNPPISEDNQERGSNYGFSNKYSYTCDWNIAPQSEGAIQSGDWIYDQPKGPTSVNSVEFELHGYDNIVPKSRKDNKVEILPSPDPPPRSNNEEISSLDEVVDYRYDASPLTLSTSLEDIKYLSVRDVFRHVTLGGMLNDESLKNLGTYIRINYPECVPDGKVTIKKINILSGTSKKININKYGWENYNMLAQACLAWASNYSESIIYS